jgi:acyl carrier protein
MKSTEEILASIAGALGVDKSLVTVDSKYGDLDDWDSMGAMNLLLMLDKKYGVKVAMGDLAKINTAKGIIDMINKDQKN